MTRAKLLLLGLIVVTTACSKSNTQPSPTAPNTFTFTATLLPSNEVPAVTNTENVARGSATIGLTVTRDSGGTITAATVTFNVSLTNFPAGSNITAAHIHQGGPTCACPVKVQTSLSSGEVIFTNGAGGFTKSFAAPTDIATDMINNPDNYYFNVHSTLNPGGVARGILVKQ